MKGFVCFYEIRHWAHSILFWWLMVIMPIAGIFTLDVIFSSGSVTDLPVAVCDLDNSSMSRQILRWVDAAPSMKAAFKPEGVEDADLLMRTGKIYASIIIPANFERDMLQLKAPQIVAYVDGRHMPIGSVLKRDLTDLGAAFWMQEDVNIRERSGIPALAAAEQSAGIGIDLRPIGNPTLNYRSFMPRALWPALIQIVFCLYLIGRLHALRESNGLEVVRTFGRFRALAGTVLPSTFWAWILLCAGDAALQFHGDLHLLYPFSWYCVLQLLLCLTTAALSIGISGLADNLVQSISFCSGLTAPALSFIGLTFPVSSMPLFGKFWSGLIPLTHIMTIDVNSFQLGAPLASQYPAFLALLTLFGTYCAIGFPLNAWRLAKALQQSPDSPDKNTPPKGSVEAVNKSSEPVGFGEAVKKDSEPESFGEAVNRDSKPESFGEAVSRASEPEIFVEAVKKGSDSVLSAEIPGSTQNSGVAS